MMDRRLIQAGLVSLALCAGAEAGYRTEELEIELPRKRFRHAAARLGDGSVAVLGGFGVYKARNVMLIPPDFSEVEALDLAGGWCGYDLAGIGLPDGNVLVINGGQEAVYDYWSKSFKCVENELPYEYIRWATLTELSTGCILVSGGSTDDFKPIQTWALYDPDKNRFTSSGTMAKPRTSHAAVELDDGSVLLVGSGSNTVEILDVRSGESTLLDASPIHERYTTRAIRLDSGRVLLVGGSKACCELFDPKTRTFSETTPLGVARREPQLWKCGNEVLVIGGENNCRLIEIYDEEAGCFRVNDALLAYPRHTGFTVTPFDETSALVVGGRANGGERKLNTIEKITLEKEVMHSNIVTQASLAGAPAAVVTIYEAGRKKRALPLSALSDEEHDFWCYRKPCTPQLYLTKGLADCLDPRMEVAFSPGLPHGERAKLMMEIGLQDVPSIQRVADLTAEEIARWMSIEDPNDLLPTEAEITAVKRMQPHVAKLVYTVHDYDPNGDPNADLLKSMDVAAREKKHILLQAGGDWCGWCSTLSEYFERNIPVSHVLSKNYVIQKVNVSKENRNEAFLSRFPKIGGFPHLFVLDAEGKLLHSQGTGALEDGGSYHDGVMLEFLNKWIPAD